VAVKDGFLGVVDAEFFLLVETGVSFSGDPFSVDTFSEMSGIGTGVFPASNADLMALKFLETIFLGTMLAARLFCGSGFCFCSKIEIRSDIGLLPD
jgi:hypothetical protein